MKSRLVRLSKLISHSGLCSRKEAESLIINGNVKINDKIFKNFFTEITKIKSIKVNNKLLSKNSTRVWVFNKPRGYVSSNKEQFSQKSLFRLIPKKLPRVVTVGRLDIDSEGLMVLTNNPTFSTFLENPKNYIERKYIVKVFGNNFSELEQNLKSRIIIKGVIYKNVKIKNLTNKNNNNILEIKLTEGKNREIRKILDFFNFKVKRLIRTNFGPFKLNKLEMGNIKEIQSSKLADIFKILKFNDENNFR